MDLDIGLALEEGFQRTFKRNGLMLVAAFFLLNTASAFSGLRAGSEAASLSSSGNAVLMSVTGIALGIISVFVSIVAIRIFVSDETENVPDRVMKRNIGSALIHTLVGGILFAIAVLAGLVLFIVPGIYLILALMFWTVFVAVEDESFFDAMQSSWEMTKGHKWRLLGLLLVVLVVNGLLSGTGGLASLGLGSTVGMVMIQFLSAVGGVFTLAVEARTYTQLAG